MAIWYCADCGADYQRYGHLTTCRFISAPSSSLVPGVGPDAPITTNAQGGKQSASDRFYRGLPPLALARIAQVIYEAAEKYEDDPYGNVLVRNWHRIAPEEHLEHVWSHLVAETAGDTSDDHLAHLATRALMALHQREAAKAYRP